MTLELIWRIALTVLPFWMVVALVYECAAIAGIVVFVVFMFGVIIYTIWFDDFMGDS